MNITFRCDPALEGHLVRPCPARGALPAWLKAMPATAFSDLHGRDVRTVKQCPPFVDAMSHGFMMPLACDIRIADGLIDWDWDLPQPSIHNHPRAPVSFHSPAQTTGAPFHGPDQIVLKFNSFWTIELPDGWSLFATHPVNRLELPFRTVTGLIDSDRFHDIGIFFPALWVEPGFSGVLPKGTPIAQCFPVRREAIDLVFAPMSAEEATSYDAIGRAVLAEPGVYRRDFRVGPVKPGTTS